MLKLRINTKILLTLLGLSLISLVLSAYIVFSNIKRLSDYALESSISLGEQAVSDSTKALKDQAEKHLLRLAKDQATISNTLFEKVEAETDIMTKYASILWNNPSSFKYKRSYSQEEKPDDIYSTSTYALAPGVTIDAIRQEFNLSSNLDDIFMPIYSNDPNLTWLYAGTESGMIRIYPWVSGIDPSFDPRVRGWYKRAKETGDIGWSELYIDVVTGRLMVTCSKAFYDSENRLIGVVGVDVTVETINQKIINTQIGELGYAFLIDNHGKVIARPGLSAKDKRWDESFETENLLHSDNTELSKVIEDMIAGNSRISRFIFEEGEKYVAYAPIISTNWSIGVVMPVEEVIAPALATRSRIISVTENTSAQINKQIESVRNILAVAFVIIISVIFVIGYRLSRRITEPILALSEGAKIVGRGNLGYHLEVKTGDEVEDLANAFNKMTNDLKTYTKNLKETTAAKERIESELKIAAEIQVSMLPRIFPPFPNRKEFDIFASMDPAKEVGGDFYDFFFIGENRLCFVIGDVSGKGVPAALFMVISRTLLKTEALRGFPPNEILFRVNNMLCPDNDACMFVTIFCGILNIETGEIQFANAGHNPPLASANSHGFEFIQMPKGFVVGIMENTEFESKKLTLKPNDIIFTYTDGVTEAMNPEAKLFSGERLKQSLSNLKGKDITNIIHEIRVQIKAFTQRAPQSDDITMLALKYNGKGT